MHIHDLSIFFLLINLHSSKSIFKCQSSVVPVVTQSIYETDEPTNTNRPTIAQYTW